MTAVETDAAASVLTGVV